MLYFAYFYILWIPTHRHPNVGQPAKNYIHQFYANTVYSLEDLSGVIDDRNRWRESVKEFCAVNMT